MGLPTSSAVKCALVEVKTAEPLFITPSIARRQSPFATKSFTLIVGLSTGASAACAKSDPASKQTAKNGLRPFMAALLRVYAGHGMMADGVPGDLLQQAVQLFFVFLADLLSGGRSGRHRRGSGAARPDLLFPVQTDDFHGGEDLRHGEAPGAAAVDD